MLEEEKFEAGAFAALAQNFAGAENFGDAADHRDDLFGLDESSSAHGEMRIGGEAAADAQRRSRLRAGRAMASGGGEADVVDLRIGAPVAAAGDGNFEFAREIVKLGVAAELRDRFRARAARRRRFLGRRGRRAGSR